MGVDGADAVGHRKNDSTTRPACPGETCSGVDGVS
jgi:hypothetical protein